MKSHSFVYTEKDELTGFIEACSFNRDKEILVQVFSAVVAKDFIQRVLNEISSLLPTAKIIGTTVAGEIYKGKSLEAPCLITFTEFEESTVDILEFEGDSKEIAETMGRIKSFEHMRDVKAMISFCSFDDIYVSGMVEFLNYDTDIILAGGAAGTPVWDEEVPLTFVFTKEKILREGLVFAILKGEGLTAYNSSSFGIVPIGREYEVTESSGSMIHKIEGQNAKNFYESHIGRKATYDLCVQFPLTFIRNEVITSSPVFLFEDSDSLLLTSDLPPGEKIRFGFGNKVDVIEGNQKAANHLADNNIEAMFFYSCFGRKQLLKDLIDEDTRPFNDLFEANGAFLFGEFNHINNHNNIYAQTLTVLGLTENAGASPDNRHKISPTSLFKDDDEEVLHHFLKSTGEELNFLTRNLELKVVEKTKELRESYLTDNLTGLSNRIKFTGDLKRYENQDIAFIKVNDFSNMNSFYGVSIMDKLLVELAELFSSAPFGEKVYRIDSSTFALCGDPATEEDFRRLQSEWHNHPFHVDGLSLSVDTVLVTVEGNRDVLEKSNAGFDFCRKNNLGFLVYEQQDDLLKKVAKNLLMIEEIKDAIADDRIEPFYQPIVDNRDEKVVKYESLMRLVKKDGDVLSPFFFLDIAIQAGLYESLTRIMIGKTFETFKNRSYEFSLNLIYADIVNDGTIALIESYLTNAELAKRTVFEIVESEDIEDYSVVRDFIDKVKGYGAKIAIDDFGTGYSNFMHLTELDVDFVKIDGSIMKHLARDESSRKVAKSIVDFAGLMNAKTIGEFIENDQVQNRAVELGVDFSQGYYFSPPVSVSELK